MVVSKTLLLVLLFFFFFPRGKITTFIVSVYEIFNLYATQKSNM